MPSELEEAAEAAKETILDRAAESIMHDRWTELIAIVTLALGLLSAVGALFAGITANEIVVDRTAEILEDVQENSSKVTVEVLHLKHAVLEALDKPVPDKERARLDGLRNTIAELSGSTAQIEKEAEGAMQNHEMFAIGVTLLSVSITLNGMSVLAKKRKLFYAGLIIAAFGTGFVATGFVNMSLD